VGAQRLHPAADQDRGQVLRAAAGAHALDDGDNDAEWTVCKEGLSHARGSHQLRMGFPNHFLVSWSPAAGSCEADAGTDHSNCEDNDNPVDCGDDADGCQWVVGDDIRGEEPHAA